MALCSAAVTNNANAKLCRVDIASNNTSLSPTVRMELLGRIIDEYRQGTEGSVERIRASKTAQNLFC